MQVDQINRTCQTMQSSPNLVKIRYNINHKKLKRLKNNTRSQWAPVFFNSLPVGPGRVAQSVTCLATDACLTADPGVASSIPVRYHTFVEIDHEIISTVILLPSTDLFKKGCCQLQAKVCAQITG